ncbi:hypothetical protein [Catenulispora subtropica]|uniref:vWA-MoxR associated conflict system protein n=1 Tax=Catenulispora subtropica TaxID=450798 RepID=UPI0031D64467
MIASQCDAERTLDHLETAARELAEALTGHGECEPGLRDGEAWICGKLTVPEIREHVAEAVAYAAQEEAVLVLGLLGHGFTPGDKSSHLYFMGRDSTLDKTLNAYDVPAAVQDIADHPDLAGLVVIVDTCAAAGAVPVADALVGGAKIGGRRLAMLVGCAVFQPGIDMRVSRGLAGVLRSGVADSGEFLSFADIKPPLETLVPDQDITYLDFNSVPGGAPLWVARNAAWPEPALRAAEHPRLHAALGALLGGAELLPQQWDRNLVADYRARILQLPWSVERDQATELLANLEIAAKAKRMLRTWLGPRLTTTLIRRAWELTGRSAPPGPLSLRAALADIADGGYPPHDPGCQYALAQFAAALGWAAGQNLEAPEVLRWFDADDVDAGEQYNEAVGRFRSLEARENQPRLVVCLASFSDGWPEELVAYLLHGDERVAREPFACPQRDETAGNRALVAAVRWGRDRARAAGGVLSRVDIAARERVLLTWCPENVKVGNRLGVGFDVRLRWSEQINPPDDIWWVNDHARDCLANLAEHDGPSPMAWLSQDHVGDREALENALVDGAYRHKALSLDHLPTDPAVFRLLKAYSAVVLWPQDAGTLSPEAREQMRLCFRRLPQSVREAYRAELRDEVGEVPGMLRTVWDDPAWLDFCDTFTPLRLDLRSEE